MAHEDLSQLAYQLQVAEELSRSLLVRQEAGELPSLHGLLDLLTAIFTLAIEVNGRQLAASTLLAESFKNRAQRVQTEL